MKVLFLDFDGVLNLFPAPSRSGNFDKQACINLEMLLNRVPDLKIVVSSSWRTYGLDAIRDILKSNGIDPRRVLDITGHEESKDERDHRGFQVENWLRKHPKVKQYVIVDDHADFVPLKDNLVQTKPTLGFTQDVAERALEILSKH